MDRPIITISQPEIEAKRLAVADAKQLADNLVNSIENGGIDISDAVRLALIADGADIATLRDANSITALAYALARMK